MGLIKFKTGPVGTGTHKVGASYRAPEVRISVPIAYRGHACTAPLQATSCHVQLGWLHQTARAAWPQRAASLQLQISQELSILAMSAAAASPSPTSSRWRTTVLDSAEMQGGAHRRQSHLQ